jgi:anti-sigma factor ChrR (cupin superfamily)
VDVVPDAGDGLQAPAPRRAQRGATYLLRVGAGEQSVLHKHLGAVEVYTVSGGWRYQEGEMWEGSYAYEPNGVIHEPEQTTTSR